MSLLTAGGLGQMTSKGPFQPKPFYDFMILNGVALTQVQLLVTLNCCLACIFCNLQTVHYHCDFSSLRSISNQLHSLHVFIFLY